MTGELMRLAIGSVGRSLVIGANGDAQNGEKEMEKGMPKEEDGLASIKSIAVFVREIKGRECFLLRFNLLFLCLD